MSTIENEYVYILLLIWLLVSWFGVNFLPQGVRKIVYFIVNYTILFFISAFRASDVGADTGAYLYAFQNIDVVELDGFFETQLFHFEFGYILLNKLLFLINDNPQTILVATSAITVIGMGYFFYKHSDNMYISTVLFIGLYFYVQLFTPVRQSMALMLIMWALASLWMGKRWHYVILILLAGSLHASSFVFLPFVLFAPLTKGKLVKICAVCGAFSIIFSFYGSALLIDVLDDEFKFYGYLVQAAENEGGHFGAATLQGIMCLIVAWFAWGALKKKGENAGEVEVQKVLWLIFMMVTMFYMIMMSYSLGYLGRMTIDFYIFICLLLPYAYQQWRSYNKFYTYPLFIFLVAIYLIQAMSRDPMIVPYSSMLL